MKILKWKINQDQNILFFIVLQILARFRFWFCYSKPWRLNSCQLYVSLLSLSPANGSNKILLSHFIFRPSLLPLTRLGATPNSTIFYPLCWSNFKTFTFFSVGKTNFLSELLSNCIEVVMFIIGTKKIKTESITWEYLQVSSNHVIYFVLSSLSWRSQSSALFTWCIVKSRSISSNRELASNGLENQIIFQMRTPVSRGKTYFWSGTSN